MKKSIIKWGVLGCARIARLQVIPAILRTPNAELAAVASRDVTKLAEFAGMFGAFTAYESYDELLNDEAIDAIYLPLPNALHCAWAIRALHAGKHVLCEKPLALNAGEARLMAEAAHDGGVLLMEAFMYRYTERTLEIQRVLESGVLGTIRSVNSSFRFFLDRENTIKENAALGGGAMYDVGCYPLNLIGLVTDAEPVAVSVEADLHNGVDTNLSALLRYESGLIASLHCGFNAFGRMHSEIIGSDGMLIAPDTFLDDAGSLELSTKAGRELIAVGKSDRYGEEIRDFSAAIIEERPPLLRLEESLRNMRTLDRIIAAIAR